MYVSANRNHTLGEPSRRLPGTPAARIDTPALVIDLDAMERNIAAMAAFARLHGMRLRPHAKSHKSEAIARLQLAAGAVGVCVQKTSEAEVLAAAGVHDIYISNEVVDPGKLARLAQLAQRVRLGIAVDSTVGVDRLAAALHGTNSSVDVMVEIDVGQGRCGVSPEAAGALARHVVDRGLRFAGLQAYHGGAQHLRSVTERQEAIAGAIAGVAQAKDMLTLQGLHCPLVTGGGTGTFALEATSGVYNELQCGSYIFMDRDYAQNNAMHGAPQFEHALFVKSGVISVGAAHAVLDAGHKSHAIDSGMPGVWQRDLVVANGGDEHAIVRVGGNDALPALGEAVWLVPGHCDPTVNLHDSFIAVRGGLEAGVVEAVWPVDARGCVS